MPDQFYSLTWNQYLLKCKGYLNKEDKLNEVIRFSVWSMINPHVSKMPSKEKFWPLRTDKTLSAEEMANKIKQRLIAAGKKFS